MTPAEFRQWQAELKLTDDQAAEKLGVAATTIRNYKRGVRDGGAVSVEIPTSVELACKYLSIEGAL